MNIEGIRKQAKEIIDKFSKELEKVKIEETRVERKEDRRQEVVLSEKEPRQSESEEFREIMFENAPEKEDECVKAEKGGWLE